MQRKYDLYEDPGHAWLKVKIAELEKLGIAILISGYSYMRGEYAYLEEDCDMATFFHAQGVVGQVPSECLRVHSTSRQSKIRGYEGYLYTGRMRVYAMTAANGRTY